MKKDRDMERSFTILRCINKPLKLKQAAFINYVQCEDVTVSPNYPFFLLDTPSVAGGSKDSTKTDTEKGSLQASAKRKSDDAKGNSRTE